MKYRIKDICMTAVFMALTFIVTRFIQIPIPLGYFNVGNTVILSSCVLLPSPFGVLIGGIGSALADLTSYPVYTLPTLVIKTIMPLIFYGICKGTKDAAPSTLRQIIAAGIATLIPLFGYTITGMFLAGSIILGIAQFPGLFLEYIANMALIILLLKPIQSMKKTMRTGV